MPPLPRDIAAAVLGYVAMFAVAFVLYSLTWTVLGADGSFAPGTWQVTGAWIAASLVLGTAVSVVGGFVCSKLSAEYRGVVILMGLVVLVGLASAIPGASAEGTARPEGVSMFEAMTAARQPPWLLWLNPVVGLVGVWLGAKLDRASAASAASTP